MDLRRYARIYEADLRKIEALVEAYEKRKAAVELDTEAIEEILLDWEEFMSELRAEDDPDCDELADEIFEKIEEFQTILDEYDKIRAEYEEKELEEKAANRLEKSPTENYLKSQADASKKPFDIARYHKASFRFNQTLQNPDNSASQKKSRLESDE